MNEQRHERHASWDDASTTDAGGRREDERSFASRTIRQHLMQRRTATTAANDARVPRAGLRQPNTQAEPTAVFVVVEMAVLVVVAALAMASIIVTSG